MFKRISVCMVLLTVWLQAAACAAEPMIDGDLRLRWQIRTGDTDAPLKGSHTIARLRLNVTLPIDPTFSVYGRVAVEQELGRRHNNGSYDTEGAVDRWGLNWKLPQGNIRVGAQELVLGEENLALTTLMDAVGSDNQLTGITVNWQQRQDEWKLVGGRMGTGFFQKNFGALQLPVHTNLYALQVKHRVDQRLQVGAQYRRIATIDNFSSWAALHNAPYNIDQFNTYSVFAGYYLDRKTKLYAELARSNTARDNVAVGIGLGHQVDAKNSYSINYFRQGVASGMFGNWGAPELSSKSYLSDTRWTAYALYWRHKLDQQKYIEFSDYYEMGNAGHAANQFRITLMSEF